MEFKVLSDEQTLYIPKELAVRLGWTTELGQKGLGLSLHGWEPTFFAITPCGSDSGVFLLCFKVQLG
jgi:hypothetical protein